MAGGWWGENRDGRTREGRAGKNEERGGEGRWKGRKDGGRAGKDGGRTMKGREGGGGGGEGRGKDKGKGAEFCGIILKELFINSLWVVNWIWRFEEVLWELYRI